MLKWLRTLCVAGLLGSPMTTAAQYNSALPLLADPTQATTQNPVTQAPKSAATPAANTAPTTTPAPSQVSLTVERHKLDNGLRVVLNPDHTIPTVAVAVYYDVGSRNEERGRSGFAHLFEHMMFQGSQNVG
jgi:hypothetical protein